MPSFYELQTDLLNIGSQDRGTDAATMGSRALNRAYRRLLDLMNMQTERRDFTFASVASTREYGMPVYVEEIVNMEDAATKRQITLMSVEEKRELYPGSTLTGTPFQYYLAGRYGTQAHPGGATITIVSNVTTDTAQVRVTGFLNSILISELITLNGTSAVTSANTYDTIEAITKVVSSTTNMTGQITVVETGASATIAVIPHWIQSPSYQWIGLHYLPDAAITYTVSAEMYKPDMVYDFDWPGIEEKYHDIILLDALTEVLPVWGKPEEASWYERKYSRRMKEMRRGHDRQIGGDKTFQDVNTGQFNFPNKPLIKGVDYV